MTSFSLEILEKVGAVLKNEIKPLLSISEEVNLLREFFDKLFMSEPQPNSTNATGRRGENSRNSRGGRQNQGGRNAVRASKMENSEEAPKSRLNALQAKFNVGVVGFEHVINLHFI